MQSQIEADLRNGRFEVLEAFSETGKARSEENEDRLVLTDDFVAVIDGATSSGPINGVPGGIVAAEAVAETVRGLAPKMLASEFIALATARISEIIGPRDASLARPSAAVTVWSAARRQVWRVGDCHIRIDDVEYVGDKLLDQLAYSFRCAVVKAELALGLTTVEAQQRVPVLEQPFRPLVLVQHAYANLADDDPLAYGTLDGRSVPLRFVEVFSTDGASEVVLCSDGFPRPYASLAEGLELIARLKANDPLMVRDFSGSRPFASSAAFYDDTTYVRLKVARS